MKQELLKIRLYDVPGGTMTVRITGVARDAAEEWISSRTWAGLPAGIQVVSWRIWDNSLLCTFNAPDILSLAVSFAKIGWTYADDFTCTHDDDAERLGTVRDAHLMCRCMPTPEDGHDQKRRRAARMVADLKRSNETLREANRALTMNYRELRETYRRDRALLHEVRQSLIEEAINVDRIGERIRTRERDRDRGT